MIISNEPGYYRAGDFGIRIENLVVVREAEDVPGGDRPMHSFETVTLAPIARNLIDPLLMSQAEIAWLDSISPACLRRAVRLADFDDGRERLARHGVPADRRLGTARCNVLRIRLRHVVEPTRDLPRRDRKLDLLGPNEKIGRAA